MGSPPSAKPGGLPPSVSRYCQRGRTRPFFGRENPAAGASPPWEGERPPRLPPAFLGTIRAPLSTIRPFRSLLCGQRSRKGRFQAHFPAWAHAAIPRNHLLFREGPSSGHPNHGETNKCSSLRLAFIEIFCLFLQHRAPKSLDRSPSTC